MQKRGGNVSLNTYADIFSTEQSRAEDRLEKVREIPLAELHPFKNHPFKVLDEDVYKRQQPGCLPVPTGEEKPILRRSGGSKKIGIREICEASAEYLHLIRVDGKLYHRMGTYFQKLDPAALGKFLFAQLPEEFAGALYNVSMEKVFKKLEATDLVEDQSMEEIRVRFSDFVALENGYYNVSSGDFYPDLEAYREIICLTGICANYQRNPEATPVFDAFIDRVSDGCLLYTSSRAGPLPDPVPALSGGDRKEKLVSGGGDTGAGVPVCED